MSGVLDRMAQRALGTLPAVQPLVTPRYAETPRESAAGLETAESETIAPVRARDARLRTVAEDERGVPRQDNRQENRSEIPEQIVQAHEAAMPVSAPVKTGARRFSAMERASQPGVERRREVEAKSEPALAERRSATARPAEVVPRREPAQIEPISEHRATSEGVSALSSNDESSRHEMVRHADPPKSNQPVRELPPGIDRSATPQRERLAAASADEKTEIHISIGSIELRAESRPEPRLPAAPFRPRVTLAEFLRRGQETRP